MSEIHEDNLPPLYKSKILDLKNELSAASSDLEKYKIIENFAKHYWILPCFWEIYRNYETDEPKELGIAIDFSILPKRSNYFRHVFWKDYELIENLCQTDLIDGILEVENALLIPCEALHRIRVLKTFYATKPPKEDYLKYRETWMLQNELKKNWDNTEAWFKTLFKLKNVEIIIANFERRLSDNKYYSDKELWKKYITFLKSVNREMMFMAYKHYTRFFIEDYEMVNEYRNEIIKEKADSKMITKWMIDTIDWEFNFGSFENARFFMLTHLNLKILQSNDNFSYTFEELQKIITDLKIQIPHFNNDVEMKDISERPKIYGNFNQFYQQQFDFPSPMLRYAFKNVSPKKVLHKLYESCKYFYANFKIPLCYRLFVGGAKTQFFQQSLQISDADYLKPQFQELISQMKILNCLQWQINSDYKSLSNSYKKLKLEHIKCLGIKNQIITLKECRYFLSLITKMNFYCSVQNENGDFMTQQELYNSLI